MIIKEIEIEQFRAFENVSFGLGRYITAISGRNATQKTTVLGMLGQPFTISKGHAMYGCKTIDGYNFRSQFKEKFKISPEHDVIGQHKWRLNLHQGVHSKEYYSVESIARRQGDREPTLRFWNSESRASGAGYIQLPVYFLSLSRLFPIGESGKTNEVQIDLTEEELKYCVKNYRQILSIQSMSEEASVGLEKGTASRTFAGISDDVHDIFSNSAGEGNITRILLAILSFKRLKEQYGRTYKGGLLLIDELDATLYGFSQMKLVEYLFEAAKEFKIQIVFTTHSPIILKCVNKLQRKEFQEKGIELPVYAYNSSVVYLEPQYDRVGTRTIMPKNIMSSSELNRILNDINLVAPGGGNKVNIYCEDKKAIDFLRYILPNSQHVNLDLYMDFIDINLGWTNYIQLYEKKVPEFRNNVIVLDGDVPQKREYRNKSRLVEESGNILILPLVIEKDLFVLLKDYECFGEFSQDYSHVSALTYDICFSEWPLDATQYNTNDFKNWFKHIEDVLGNQNILFQYWCDKNADKVAAFIDDFIPKFNVLAEQKDADGLPPIIAAESELVEDSED